MPIWGWIVIGFIVLFLVTMCFKGGRRFWVACADLLGDLLEAILKFD